MTRPAYAIRAAGVGCGLAGLTFFGDLALHRVSPLLGRGYYPVAALVGIGFAVAAFGVRRVAVGARGWPRALGAAGAAFAALGALLWLAAFALLAVRPGARFTQKLTPGGSLLLALGMLALGAAVLGSRRASGWRRAAPLLVGAYFPLQLVLQLAFFLGGRDGVPGPRGELLGAWGLLWAWLGVGLATGPAGRPEGRAPA
ncbi:hypothetical protein [Roseisolibacter sp. H3M3-2]|uniref:hypothetical protein n=1 Tax=Roseisolibacter sp. H3M3-2 TaxID=3031323 RepID=UPI0023DB31AE|nr:hypothetical protein [Roseisolibacter sp. H3M3-2]MDF1505554.1 hypothetical protein [Roseisolibacter sp. H3M3-2]